MPLACASPDAGFTGGDLLLEDISSTGILRWTDTQMRTVCVIYMFITSALPLENGEMCAVSCVPKSHLWRSPENGIIFSQIAVTIYVKKGDAAWLKNLVFPSAF